MNKRNVLRSGLWLATGMTLWQVGCQTNLYSIGVQGTSLAIQSVIYQSIAVIAQLVAGYYGTA